MNHPKTDQEIARLDSMLTETMGVFKHSMTQFEGSMWAKIIDSVDARSFEAFLQQHLFTSKFAPMPADACKAFGIGGSNPDEAYGVMMEAVRTVGPYKAPDFADQVLVAAIQHMGGWAQVNSQMPDITESFSVKAFRDRFDSAYRLAANQVQIQGKKPNPLRQIGCEEPAPMSVAYEVDAPRISPGQR